MLTAYSVISERASYLNNMPCYDVRLRFYDLRYAFLLRPTLFFFKIIVFYSLPTSSRFTIIIVIFFHRWGHHDHFDVAGKNCLYNIALLSALEEPVNSLGYSRDLIIQQKHHIFRYRSTENQKYTFSSVN